MSLKSNYIISYSARLGVYRFVLMTLIMATNDNHIEG